MWETAVLYPGYVVYSIYGHWHMYGCYFLRQEPRKVKYGCILYVVHMLLIVKAKIYIDT